MKRISKRSWSNNQLIEAIKNNTSLAGVLRDLGLSPKGGNYRIVKRVISELGLDTSNITGKPSKDISSLSKSKQKLENILIKNSSYRSTNCLKLRLLNEKIKEHKCEKCGRTEWEGKPIPLELHHVNGDHTDLRIENLQLLCPNCHALTDNYRGKGKDSHNCKKKLEYESVIEDNRPEKEPKYCLYCGKDITNKRSTSRYCSKECSDKDKIGKSRINLKEVVPLFNKEELLIELRKFNGNYSKLSKNCGIDRGTIREYVKKFGLEKEVENLRNSTFKKDQ